MDMDFELECGCVVAINHGDWDYDLSSTDDCAEGHSFSEAVAIAARH